MTNQGKIGILPFKIREELNLRLLDGQSGRKILPWLNSLPEVEKLLAENAEGLNVSDSNLSTWRNGGYAQWLQRRQHVAELKEMSQFSVQLAKASGGNLTEGAAAILSGKILQVLEGLKNLSDPADPANPADPADAAAKTTALAAAIGSLTESLASLRAGDQQQRKIAQYDERTRLLEGQLEKAQDMLSLAREKQAILACTLFVKWANDQAAVEIALSSVPTPEKIAKLRQAYFADVDAYEASGQLEKLLPKP